MNLCVNKIHQPPQQNMCVVYNDNVHNFVWRVAGWCVYLVDLCTYMHVHKQLKISQPPFPHMHTNYTQLTPTKTVCILCVCMHGEVLVCLLGWSTNVHVRMQTKIRQPPTKNSQAVSAYHNQYICFISPLTI